MQLEVGKKYRTRDGETIMQCMEIGSEPWPCEMKCIKTSNVDLWTIGELDYYSKDGSFRGSIY